LYGPTLTDLSNNTRYKNAGAEITDRLLGIFPSKYFDSWN
jgi:hypothetical protein